jgi:hypothetical protein
VLTKGRNGHTTTISNSSTVDKEVDKEAAAADSNQDPMLPTAAVVVVRPVAEEGET